MDEVMREGSPPVIVEVQGITFSWIGTLHWGHQPFSADPTLWECGECRLATASPGPHARQHNRHDRLWSRVMARLGLTDEGNPSADA